MSLMVDRESGVGGSDENLFLKRHHVSGIPFLISEDSIQIDEFRRCGGIDDLATSKIII